jgi:hypothetical protein
VSNPALLDLTIESRLNSPGGRVRVRLRNWMSNLFEQVHQYAQGTIEATEVIPNVDATDHVRAADGRIEMSIRQSVIVVFSAAGFDSFFDRIGADVH